jgi:hypothetical protein
MKLYIDDIRTPPDESWNICRSALSAVRALDMFWEQVTDIALDHDISHQVAVGKMSRPYPCEETFEIVARHIAALRCLHPAWEPRTSIHTSNPAGASNMKAILEHAGLKPTVALARGANRLETIL